MTKPNFNVKITKYETLNEISGAWTQADFQNLLAEMDFPLDEGSSIEETKELCLMSLQDRPKEEAAEIVLKYKLSDKLAAGQIKNAAIELADEKLWEQFADLSLHETLFHVGSLMYQVDPGSYHEPDAVKLTIEVEGRNETAKELIEQPVNESLLGRLLADGMEADSILLRLFDDQLASDSFPEASSIVWIINPISQKDNVATIEVISSAHWLDSLKDVDTFESQALPDSVKTVD